jgi:hypothetical protein
LGYDYAIYLYDNVTWRALSFESVYTDMNHVVSDEPIGFSPDGYLWVIHEGIPASYDGRKQEQPFVDVNDRCHAYAWDATIDWDGNIWVLPTYFGSASICLFEVGKERPEEFDLYFTPRDLAISRDGVLWMALSNGYVASLPVDQLKANDLSGIELTRISSATAPEYSGYSRIEIAPDGTVWVILHGEGVYSFAGDDWRYHGMNQINNTSAFAIGPGGEVWVGLPEELRKFNGRGWTSYPLPGKTPNKMTVAQDGSVWFLSNDELYQYENSDLKFYPLGQRHDIVGSISKLLVAPDGALWFLSLERWYRFQPGEGDG